MLVVCAAAVSFSALCAGFGENFTNAQDDLMNKISDREIWVVNATSPEHEKGKVQTLPDDLAFTAEQLELFEKIAELEAIFPYFEFVSSLYAEGQAEPVERKVTVEGNNVFFGEEQKEYSYTIIPYHPDQLMDLKSETLDETVENGIYLSAPMAECLGVAEPGVTLTAEAMVPFKLKIMELETENGKFAADYDICVKDSVTGTVRGILENQVKNSYSQTSENVIYVPYEQMKTLLDKHEAATVSDGEDVWRPSACIMTAASYHSVTSAIEKLSRIDKSFLVYNRFQDFASMKGSIQTIRDMTMIVSFIILAIIFLLVAVVYMNYVESRKFEFSILKANGMTRREIRRLVFTESFLQAVKTAAIAVFFAVGLGLVTNFLVFGNELITFDLQLFLVIALISLLSIITPTVITLTFVNRYDPDQVMRN